MTGVLPALDAVTLGDALDAAVERVARTESAELVACTWAHPTLVLGSAQPLASVDLAACAGDGVAVERRRSGGGAVYCDRGLLEVDLVVPITAVPGAQDVTESYRVWGEAWASALAKLGFECRLVTVDESRGQSDGRRAAARVACWAGLSPHEVLGRAGGKLVGFSQRRRQGLMLLQAGICCGTPPDRLADYLALDAETSREVSLALASGGSLERAGRPLRPEALWSLVAADLTAVAARFRSSG